MSKKAYFARTKGMLFSIMIVCILVGCAEKISSQEAHNTNEVPTSSEQKSFPSATATPTEEILPTRTPDLYQPETVRAADATDATQNAGRPTTTPKPSPTPTLSSKQLCQPFPDSIQYLGSTQTLGFPAWTIRGRCHGDVTYCRSPVGDMTLYDYTPLTGRFAFGSPDSAGDGLWVYDYWTELSEKWLDESVIRVEWAPVKNSQGVQLPAILNSEGKLSLASASFKIESIAENVSFFSFAPTGDRLAYVKDFVLYVVGLDSGQPRKLAEYVYGTPAWALEENALIFPSSPVKIAKLDGSGSFTPQEIPSITNRIEDFCQGKRSCKFSTNMNPNHLLWNERNNLIVFYSTTPTSEVNLPRASKRKFFILFRELVRAICPGEIPRKKPLWGLPPPNPRLPFLPTASFGASRLFPVNFRTLYVYELSEDLQRIVNRQTIFGDFSNHIEWDVPGESIIDSAGNEAKIGPPPEVFFIHAKINSISDQELGVDFMWTNSWATSRYGHQFTQVMVTDQTQIVDINGDLTRLDAIKSGMTIELTARKLSPYTLSLFAYKIQVYCDQTPCYLGFEARS